MIFSSKTPRDLNRDPESFLDERGSRWISPVTFQPRTFTYSPRPQFDHVQHNETNPILTWFRAVIEDPKCGEFDQVVDDFLIYHIKGHGKQEHHARRVLARLANLAQGQ